MSGQENTMANALKIIAWCCLAVGFLLGIIFGTWDRPEEIDSLSSINELIMLTYIIGGIIWCVIFLGFSEVISLLQGIYNQGEKKGKQTSVKKKSDVITKQDLTPHAENEIRSYYATRNRLIDSIKSTVIEDVYCVQVEGTVEYIELGGFKPKVLMEEVLNKMLK